MLIAESYKRYPVYLKIFVFVLLLYSVGALQFFKSAVLLTIMFYGMMLIGLLSFAHFCFTRGLNKLLLAIALYAFLFPLYASYQSWEIFDQPFLLGFASLRYKWIICLACFLYLIHYPFALLIKQINGLNLWVAGISIIGFFFFGVNKLTLQPYLFDTNTIELVTSEVAFNTKGAFLTTCSELMIFSYIYYLLSALQRPDKKTLFKLLILVVYLIFVNKGRQPLAVMGIIYFIYFIRMGRLSGKKIFLALLPVLGISLIFCIDSGVFDRFTTVFQGTETSDSSTAARINSVTSVWPYIQEHFLLGIGNLSARFRHEGFHTYFGDQFYMADIGIVGMLAMGGIILMLIYTMIYYNSFKRLSLIPVYYRQYVQYMLMTFVLMLVFLSHDILFSTGCIKYALLCYPLLGNSSARFFAKR